MSHVLQSHWLAFCVLLCAFHCTFDDFVSNCYIHKFAKARMIVENLTLKIKF